MEKRVKKPVRKPIAKRTSDAMTRARQLMTDMRTARRAPRRTITLSELGVMLDGPGPFDDARVLAKIPVRPGYLSADQITTRSKAQHSTLASKLVRKGRKKRPTTG